MMSRAHRDRRRAALLAAVLVVSAGCNSETGGDERSADTTVGVDATSDATSDAATSTIPAATTTIPAETGGAFPELGTLEAWLRTVPQGPDRLSVSRLASAIEAAGATPGSADASAVARLAFGRGPGYEILAHAVDDELTRAVLGAEADISWSVDPSASTWETGVLVGTDAAGFAEFLDEERHSAEQVDGVSLYAMDEPSLLVDGMDGGLIGVDPRIGAVVFLSDDSTADAGALLGQRAVEPSVLDDAAFVAALEAVGEFHFLRAAQPMPVRWDQYPRPALVAAATLVEGAGSQTDTLVVVYENDTDAASAEQLLREYVASDDGADRWYAGGEIVLDGRTLVMRFPGLDEPLLLNGFIRLSLPPIALDR